MLTKGGRGHQKVIKVAEEDQCVNKRWQRWKRQLLSSVRGRAGEWGPETIQLVAPQCNTQCTADCIAHYLAKALCKQPNVPPVTITMSLGSDVNSVGAQFGSHFAHQ